MEEDILNYSPIVMFRGTPCMFIKCTLYAVGGDVINPGTIYTLLVWAKMFFCIKFDNVRVSL